MIPIKQTILDFESGNCFASCIASILEMSLEEIPNFCAKGTDTFDTEGLREDWFERARKWLLERDWLMIMFDWPATNARIHVPDSWAIISGTSPRNSEKQHCVVGRTRTVLALHEEGTGTLLHVDLFHDPHPSDDFIVGDPSDVIVLIKCDHIIQNRP